MFKVSKVRYNIRTTTVDLAGMQEFADLLNDLKNSSKHVKPAISPGIFHDNYRNLVNFQEAYTICLDFDGTLGDTPDEARAKIHELFDEYTYIAVKSRNYMLAKGPLEKPKPRYHIWFPLEEPIKTESDFRATYKHLLNNYQQADDSCSDPSRQFYAGQEVDWTHEGKSVKVIRAKQTEIPVVTIIPKDVRGWVNKKTADFFIRGPQETSWHHETVAVLYDLKAQGYSKKEAIAAIGRVAAYPLDDNDMARINDIYDNRTPTNEFNGEKMPFTLPDLNKRKEMFEKDKELVKESLACQFSFICSEFDKYFKLANGFHMVGAPTGRGKTTTASNIIARYLKQSEKQVVVISNEENNFDVNGRIACVMLNKNFFKYRRGELPDHEEIEEYIEQVRPRLAVITTNDDYDMTILEDVQMVFEKVNEYEDVGLVVVDYMQTVVKSKESSNASPYEVTKRLGTFMKEFCRVNKLPVVGLVQMRPNKSDFPESYESRVQGDRHLANHCMSFVEVLPNFENNITDFHIHKNRFGEKTIHPIQLLYANGSYQPLVNKNEFV